MSSTFTQSIFFVWFSPKLSNEGILRRLAVAFGKWHADRKALAELSALDDRMLRDIGIDRSEISSVLRDRTGERLVGPEAWPSDTRA